MIKIGITGNIGSGKSTVSKILEKKGYPVFNCDEAARLVRNDRKVQDLILGAFGSKILTENPYSESYLDEYYLDSAKLAHIVFNDPEKMRILTDIVHPEVNKKLKNWYKEQENSLGISSSSTKKVFVENAIIFETNTNKEYDEILIVHAPEKIRIERVMKRDSASEDEVRARMNFQHDENYKLENADYVIYNYADHPIEEQIDVYLKRLSSKTFKK